MPVGLIAHMPKKHDVRTIGRPYHNISVIITFFIQLENVILYVLRVFSPNLQTTLYFHTD
jgi:hypothetical protein